jgi:mannitol operon repressor
MAKRKTKPDPLNDWEGFYEELQNETPRAAVIIAAAFLDGRLRQLIANFMVEDSKVVDGLLGTEDNPDCPLSTFASRIKAAYCLGLISKGEYADLNTIRKIRNHFAHKMHGLSFDDDEIVSWCNSLQGAEELILALTDFPRSHRSMFLVGVSSLASRIAIRTLETEKARRTVPKGFKMGQVVRVSGGGSTKVTHNAG